MSILRSFALRNSMSVAALVGASAISVPASAQQVASPAGGQRPPEFTVPTPIIEEKPTAVPGVSIQAPAATQAPRKPGANNATTATPSGPASAKPKPQAAPTTNSPGTAAAGGAPESGSAAADGGAGEGDSSALAGATGGGATRTVEQITNVSEVTAKQIEASGAKTLDQAIRLVPGVYVRDGAGDGVPRIDIRGLRTRNILILLDGIPLNSSFDGQFDPRAIPVENIARIKIIQGGSSVLYGSGGNAAVIDIVTKSAAAGLHGTAEGEYGFGRNSKRGAVTSSYGSEAVKVFMSASALEQDKWELSDDFTPTRNQPAGDRINTDRSDRQLYGNVTFDPSIATRIGVSVSYKTGEYGKAPNTVSQTDNPTFGRNIRFERVDDYEGWNLQASVLQKLGPNITIRPILFYNELAELTNRYDNARYNTQTAANSFRENAVTKIYGGGVQAGLAWGNGQLLTVAFNGQNESWDATGFNNVNVRVGRNNVVRAQPLAQDRSIENYSVAAEQELKLTSAWSAVAGLGYAEHRRDERDDNGYTYLVGTRYALTADTAVRGSVARKIRFPTLRDLYAVSGNVGNPQLKPEVTQNYEVGVEHFVRRANVLLNVALFRTDAKDFIEADAAGIFRNFAQYDFRGVQSSARFAGVRNLDVLLGHTYLESENQSPGSDTRVLQARPRHKFTSTIDYRFDTGTKLHADYLFSGGSRDLSRTLPTRTIDLKDYHLLNLGVSQEVLNGALEVHVRAENVLDQTYEDNFGFPQSGRAFFIGGKARF
ncbi:MAG: TonB-dependent receptor [Hyphomicrobiaceae bacterium]|nr:TonB-dependent receptor [Hyphomicrobiaceae bacterium]